MGDHIPLTIAQHITQNAPYHPAAHHGASEVKKNKDKKHTDIVLKVANTSSSIVDKWMQDIKKKHKLGDSEKQINNSTHQDTGFRQPRLGLGAKYLPHSKVNSTIVQPTSKVETAILKKARITEISDQNNQDLVITEKKEEIILEEFEDSRIDSIILSSRQKDKAIPKSTGVKKSKKKKKPKRRSWY